MSHKRKDMEELITHCLVKGITTKRQHRQLCNTLEKQNCEKTSSFGEFEKGYIKG